MNDAQAVERAARECGWEVLHVFDGEDWVRSDFCHLSGNPQLNILLQQCRQDRFKGAIDALALQLFRKLGVPWNEHEHIIYLTPCLEALGRDSIDAIKEMLR